MEGDIYFQTQKSTKKMYILCIPNLLKSYNGFVWETVWNWRYLCLLIILPFTKAHKLHFWKTTILFIFQQKCIGRYAALHIKFSVTSLSLYCWCEFGWECLSVQNMEVGLWVQKELRVFGKHVWCLFLQFRFIPLVVQKSQCSEWKFISVWFTPVKSVFIFKMKWKWIWQSFITLVVVHIVAFGKWHVVRVVLKG